MSASYKLGCLPNDPFKPRVQLKRRPGVSISPPESVDYYSAFPANSWGMLGNDSTGCCVAAGALHLEDVVQYFGENRIPGFTDQDCLDMYSAISGYVPGRPETDVGATLQSGLDYMRKIGVDGYQLEAFAEIDFRDTDLLKQCIADFGVTYLALQVPDSAMAQFDQGQPWDVVKRSRIEGGHCVVGVGYDADFLYVITWGAVQRVTWRFYATYFLENWVGIDSDWLSSTGKTPAGMDWAAANAAYQALTQDSTAPFPQVDPDPEPEPEPEPEPTPIPVPVDVPPGIGDVLAPMLAQWKAALDSQVAELQTQAGALVAQAAAVQSQSDVLGVALADMDGGEDVVPPVDVEPPHVHGH